MAIFDAYTDEQQAAVVKRLKEGIKAPVVGVRISTLGGAEIASAMISLSLDPKSTWVNGIYENSRYAHLDLERNGTMTMFTVSYKIGDKMRKTTVKSLEDAIAKINAFVNKNGGTPVSGEEARAQVFARRRQPKARKQDNPTLGSMR